MINRTPRLRPSLDLQLSAPQPPLIPDHELLKKIGVGSYGEVWLARSAVGTLRAVKIVWRKTFWSDHPFEREFRGIQKFEPISREHVGLVDILQIGRGDGYFYYVMELADAAEPRGEDGGLRMEDGNSSQAPSRLPPSSTLNPQSYAPRTLQSDLAQHGRLPVNECLRIGATLASALAHLHRHKLVHRDVKPANVIFVGGAPKLADIGLVTETSEARSYVGTEGFIPPEGPGTPLADLYSLGKLLYEISTGKDRHAFPELPSDLAEQSEAEQLVELNAILLKACQPDPHQRYQSAKEMHADLELLQRGSSVRQKHAIQRGRALATKAIFSFAAVAILAVAAWMLSTKLAWRNPETTWAKADLKKPPSPEVIQLCKLGNEAAGKGTRAGLTEAFELLNRAAALDPGYVPAYLGLASTYNAATDWLLPPWQALPELERAATSALQIDPASAEARQWLGVFKMEFEWDWAGAEADFKRAIQLDSKSPWPHMFYAILLLNLKRLPEARVEQERGLQLAPNEPGIVSGMVRVCFAEQRFEDALKLALNGRREHTNSLALRIWLAWIYEQKRMYPQAIAELRSARDIDEGPDLIAFHGYLYAVSGDRKRARELLKELQGTSAWRVPQYYEALLHVGLEDADAAIGCLEKAVAEKSTSLSGPAPFLPIAIDPHFDPLRSDPRFDELLRKMRLKR